MPAAAGDDVVEVGVTLIGDGGGLRALDAATGETKAKLADPSKLVAMVVIRWKTRKRSRIGSAYRCTG